jgi:hypothetical protein
MRLDPSPRLVIQPVQLATHRRLPSRSLESKPAMIRYSLIEYEP